MSGDERRARDLEIRERAEAALRTMNFSHWVDLTYRKDGKELTEQGDWLKPALRRLIELLDKEAIRDSGAVGKIPEFGVTVKTPNEVFEDDLLEDEDGAPFPEEVQRAFRARVGEREERMNSVGTCGICGYQGPGPKHDCKIRLIIRSPGDS